MASIRRNFSSRCAPQHTARLSPREVTVPHSHHTTIWRENSAGLWRGLNTRQVSHQVAFAGQGHDQKKQQKFSSFDALLKQKPIVLVDFYATWCGPCQMMSKVMSECSSLVKDVAFVKVDTEKYPAIATRFQVQALPTLVLFKNGSAVARVEGALSASQLRQWIMQNISS